ncbi:unnamed protein product [Ambrosiozyma monospora]|uniref:Unnamed protein product n=1 Tax=Ambrosiozyma monospora TaxID=43982 RepID=A0ACB5UCK6_AMBMO|nr:unnamed protein product [Ambrosiozyma monospora]
MTSETPKTKEDVLQLLSSSREATKYWTEALPTPSTSKSKTIVPSEEQLSNQIKAAKLENPLEELVKLMKLIHAHATKLGLVFKPPIASTSFNACYQELETTSKTIILLVSLVRQLLDEVKIYSRLFVGEITSQVKLLLSNFAGLTLELETRTRWTFGFSW